MPVVGKTRHIKSNRRLISVSAEKVSRILVAVKEIDPMAHIVEEALYEKGFIAPEDSKWYRDVKAAWHPGISLRIRRENAGLTQAQLANMTNIAAANISAIENGRRSMGLNVARKLAEVLKRPISEFIENEE